MTARPIVLTADERTVIESLAHDHMLGSVLADPKYGMESIRLSSRGGGDLFTTVDWTEERAIVRRWYDPTPLDFRDACPDEKRGRPISNFHRQFHVDGRCVKSWDRGEPVRVARITWRRLEAWAASLPADIRERARTEWREPEQLVRDALASEVSAEFVGQGVLW